MSPAGGQGLPQLVALPVQASHLGPAARSGGGVGWKDDGCTVVVLGAGFRQVGQLLAVGVLVEGWGLHTLRAAL